MLKILIADDYPVIRNGLRHIIATAKDMVVAGEATTAAEVLALVRREPWDMLLLDITLPGKSGLEVLKEVKIERPDLPVLILSMHPEEVYAVRTLKAGAAGYLTKDSEPEYLIAAIRKVAAGGRYVSESFGEQLASSLQAGATSPRHAALSDRELEVLCRMAAGESVTEMAHALSLSVKTISTYRTRIMRKMAFRSNADLIRYAIEDGLVRRPT